MERHREDDGREEDPNAKRARIEANIAVAKKKLFSLARNGDLAELQTFVNSMNAENGERAKLINSADHAGRTILHIATFSNNLPMIRWILSDSGGRAAGFNNILAKARRVLLDAMQRRRFVAFLAIVEGCKVENGERAELVNTVDDRQRTILYLAAENNDLPTIEWLLSDSGGRAAGFNKILAKSDDGGTALHFAVQRRRFVAFLAIVEGCKVENGERTELVNTVDDRQRTILYLAAENNDLPTIKWLLSDSGGRAAGFNKVLAKTNQGQMALHTAVTLQAFLAIVEGCKVENGERAAMLNDVDIRGATVLHHVASRGSEDIMKWVLSEQGRDAGFNPDTLFALTKIKESVLHTATQSGLSGECLDLILAQCRNAEERCRLLFGVDNNGWTLLHYAASSERLPSSEWVVSRLQEERGGSNEDLFALTNNNESALHFAAGKGIVESFDILLSQCNNTSERLRLFLGRDDKGWTIFHHASRREKAEKISHILRTYPEESKMIINTRDHRGMTALHRVIVRGLDEESREEWRYLRRWNDRQIVDARTVAAALLGPNEPSERVVAAMDDGEENGKNKTPVEATQVSIAVAGIDPNVGLLRLE